MALDEKWLILVMNLMAIFSLTFLFLSGLHSLDISRNMLKISYEQKLPLYENYTDCNVLNDKCYGYEELYNKGFGNILISFCGLALVLIINTVFL